MDFIIEFIKKEEFFIIFFINIILIILNSILISLIIKNRKNIINLENKNIDNIFKKYLKEINKINDENQKLSDFCNRLDKNIDKAIQKVGIIKYNAFENIVGDLSFAVALLDGNNSGIILNGIYGLQSCNLYAKPIEKGKSKIELSREEKEALNKAIKGK